MTIMVSILGTVIACIVVGCLIARASYEDDW